MEVRESESDRLVSSGEGSKAKARDFVLVAVYSQAATLI